MISRELEKVAGDEARKGCRGQISCLARLSKKLGFYSKYIGISLECHLGSGVRMAEKSSSLRIQINLVNG